VAVKPLLNSFDDMWFKTPELFRASSAALREHASMISAQAL
jgi:hypothetical protein